MRIIVSPSGKLYGSENVLFDYLNHSSISFDFIFVPKNSPFKKKLEDNNFTTNGFGNVKELYFLVFLKLLTNKIKHFYCNEAGHVRYIVVLARLFPKVNFVVHVRILEDSKRISISLKNLQFVAISQTIQKALHGSSRLIYDGFHFKESKFFKPAPLGNCKIGIVGRITSSKGIDLFTQKFLQNCGSKIELHFYGDIDKEYEKSVIFQNLIALKNIHIHGFISDKNQIYSSIDILLHVNEFEPLGRIFFESLDFGIPFIGINKGGIAEIANQINYPYVFEKDQFAELLSSLTKQEFSFDFLILENSRKLVLEVFSIEKYTNQIDRILL